ncbi:MAG TPA: uroporphyrinogen-III synthase [Chlamydiales bacterium]|nr:uroporphyrinogen-III synthase [Chlamydiales bacterium]
MHKCLYLGLDPPPHVFHYPVICTERIDSPFVAEANLQWEKMTHLIFTSKRAVTYWEEMRPLRGDKVCIAIGPGTGDELKKRGIQPLIAPYATQEGVIAVIEEVEKKEKDSFFFYPHSLGARPLLAEYLAKRGVRYLEFSLYRTLLQRKEPVPNPFDFDEIVFTSPSTVDGFLAIFGSLPKGPRLTSIGPITRAKLIASVFSWV